MKNERCNQDDARSGRTGGGDVALRWGRGFAGSVTHAEWRLRDDFAWNFEFIRLNPTESEWSIFQTHSSCSEQDSGATGRGQKIEEDEEEESSGEEGTAKNMKLRNKAILKMQESADFTGVKGWFWR